MERIILGSGHVYYQEFDGTIPETEEICTEENRLAFIQGGAELSYKPSYYKAQDDMGRVTKTIMTEEEATLKSGICTFDGKKFLVLCETARVTEDSGQKTRTVKIGGIGNQTGKRYVICFHHVDKTDGDIWVMIVGNNQAGFTMTFAKDKETVVDAEFTCLPMDDEGTLIQYTEKDKTIAEALKASNEETEKTE